jgi:hypothetical protein
VRVDDARAATVWELRVADDVSETTSAGDEELRAFRSFRTKRPA